VLAVLLPLLNRKGTREGNGEEREREREFSVPPSKGTAKFSSYLLPNEMKNREKK
jgi:hypothetical protein